MSTINTNVYNVSYLCDLLEEQGVKLPDHITNISFDLLPMPESVGKITFECLATIDFVEAFLKAYITTQVRDRLERGEGIK